VVDSYELHVMMKVQEIKPVFYAMAFYTYNVKKVTVKGLCCCNEATLAVSQFWCSLNKSTYSFFFSVENSYEIPF
jgi:hypothetical protein